MDSLTTAAKFQLAYFLDFGPKSILFHAKCVSFHSHFNHGGSADPNLNQ